LDRGGHTGRKTGGDRRCAVRANAALRTMLDDLDADGGKLEDLAALAILRMKRPGTFAEERPAAGTARILTETMFDRTVRVLGLKQGLTDRTVLPAGLASRLVPQAPGFWRRGEVAAIRRRGRLLLRSATASGCVRVHEPSPQAPRHGPKASRPNPQWPRDHSWQER
jgi:hypothetical protein